MITQAPDQVPYQIVGLAVRALPAGHRERYRREFTAELYFLPHRQQLRYATRILARVWALRVAVGGLAPAPIEEKAMSVKVIPLHCQLNLKHRWEIHSTEDGGNRFRVCAQCGKHDYRSRGGPFDVITG